MTDYERRKLEHECTKGCGRTAAADHQLCDVCAPAQRDYQRRCMAQLRELRRDNGLCAQCSAPSPDRYRCTTCAPARVAVAFAL